MQDTDHLCELRTGQGRRSIFTGHFHRAFSPGIFTGHFHRAFSPGIFTGHFHRHSEWSFSTA
jgi:hypothetical protein